MIRSLMKKLATMGWGSDGRKNRGKGGSTGAVSRRQNKKLARNRMSKIVRKDLEREAT